MKLPNNRTIADCWLPTFENVAREFIIDSLGKILCSDEIPNFKFEFREKEAIEFIENIMKQYTNSFKDSEYKEEIQARYEKIFDIIKQKTKYGCYLQPYCYYNRMYLQMVVLAQQR